MSYISIVKSSEIVAESFDNGLPNIGKLRTASISINSNVSPPDTACIETQNVQLYYLATPKYTIIGLSSSEHPPRQVLKILKTIDLKLQTSSEFQAVADHVRDEIIKSTDRLQIAEDELHQVRKIMVRNLDNVLERGERVNLLVDRTAEMSQQAALFNQQARQLKTRTRFKNYKVIGLLAGVSLSVVVVLTKVF